MAARVQRGRRIVVLCEGKTEECAIRFFVHRQWVKDGFSAIGLNRVNLRGHLDKVASFASNYLDDTDVLAVFTLVDLYGMNQVTHLANDELDVRVQRVQNWLRGRLRQHNRASDFIPHVSVHEVEAWILAEGTALAARLENQPIKPDPQAEVKNFQNPPSRRISDFFLKSRGRHYQKIEDGELLFCKMEFQPVYDFCPYFRKFYDELKVAARS